MKWLGVFHAHQSVLRKATLAESWRAVLAILLVHPVVKEFQGVDV